MKKLIVQSIDRKHEELFQDFSHYFISFFSLQDLYSERTYNLAYMIHIIEK